MFVPGSPLLHPAVQSLRQIAGLRKAARPLELKMLPVLLLDGNEISLTLKGHPHSSLQELEAVPNI